MNGVKAGKAVGWLNRNVANIGWVLNLLLFLCVVIYAATKSQLLIIVGVLVFASGIALPFVDAAIQAAWEMYCLRKAYGDDDETHT